MNFSKDFFFWIHLLCRPSFTTSAGQTVFPRGSCHYLAELNRRRASPVVPRIPA